MYKRVYIHTCVPAGHQYQEVIGIYVEIVHEHICGKGASSHTYWYVEIMLQQICRKGAYMHAYVYT